MKKFNEFILESNYADGWISVDSYEDIPEGNWLVYLEKEHSFSNMHTIHVGKNMSTIGGHFAWDCPRVIAYRMLPEAPIDLDTKKKVDDL